MTTRRGFTLLEILAAIVLAAGVAATARALVNTIGDAGTRMVSAAAVGDAAAGGEMLGRTVIRQARTLPGDSVSLFGTSRGFVIRSWCPVPGGWSEPCDAAFAVNDSSALVLRAGVGANLVVTFQANRMISLRYLVSSANGGRWVDRWTDNELPLAIGIIRDADTLLVPAGR